MINKLTNYLDEMFPDAYCELEYKKDYELLIAVVLSAQTTDKQVNLVTKVLFDRYKSLEELSKANLNDLEDIIKPIGTYHKKAMFVKEIACILIDKYNSSVPNTHKELEKLPGVGHKTANVVLGNIYNIPSFAVDTHVSRVSKRLGFARDDDGVEEIEKKMKKKLSRDRWIKTHHQLVLFGRYHCKSKNPNCINCKLVNDCKYYKKNSH